MKIQLVNAYLNLSRDLGAPPILCGNDPDHGIPVGGIDEEYTPTLECLACTWKIKIGLKMYESMKEILIMSDYEWLMFDDKD